MPYKSLDYNNSNDMSILKDMLSLAEPHLKNNDLWSAYHTVLQAGGGNKYSELINFLTQALIDAGVNIFDSKYGLIDVLPSWTEDVDFRNKDFHYNLQIASSRVFTFAKNVETITISADVDRIYPTFFDVLFTTNPNIHFNYEGTEEEFYKKWAVTVNSERFKDFIKENDLITFIQ